MTLNETSQDFRAFFLLEFTKQLIKSSSPMDLFKLKTIVNEEEIGEKKKFREDIKEKVEKKTFPEKNVFNKLSNALEVPKFNQPIKDKTPVLRIPEHRFFGRLEYLQPFPTEIEIDLGKLNPLIMDSQVQSIECNGPNKEIIVRGTFGEKTTQLTLTEEEITEIINNVSDKAKIPVNEGFYRVAIGRILFLAIVSNVIVSKFIIKKMQPPSFFNAYRR